uniref:Uncharacterized protein n=1 Tax=Arundo donax TaxID=35708 RepID=A0A0A9A003_ARUDO
MCLQVKLVSFIKNCNNEAFALRKKRNMHTISRS